MARGLICTFCEDKLSSGQAFCEKCGHPTQWATHDERVLWELGQWEASRRTETAEQQQGSRAVRSATRSQALAENVRGRATTLEDHQQNGHEANGGGGQGARRTLLSRFRRVAPPDAVPATGAAAEHLALPARPASTQTSPVRPAAAAAKPAAPVVRQAASAPLTAPAVPKRTVAPAPAAPAARAPKAPPTRVAPAARAPQVAQQSRPSAPVAPAASAPAAATAIQASPEIRAPETRQAPAGRPSDAPLVLVRKPVAKPSFAPAQPPAQRNGKAQAQAPPRPATPPRPAAAPPRPAPQARPAASPPPPKQERKKDPRKEAEKRERKHRRHSKRVNRRAASLDLKDGERVSLSIEGWSRFRRATLVVTNYRVALITRVPPQVRWIPLEEVASVVHRWQGAHSIVVTAPTEVLTLQKRKRQMLASFQELLESEVKEARRSGSLRHNADITQEWCERATEVWDSRVQRLRLWIRKHPTVTIGTLTTCVIAAFVLTSVMTSFFSPVR